MREAVFSQTLLRYPSHHQAVMKCTVFLLYMSDSDFCIIYLICNLCMLQFGQCLSRTFPFLVIASAWNGENSFFLKGSTWGMIAKSWGCGWWNGRGQQLIQQNHILMWNTRVGFLFSSESALFFNEKSHLRNTRISLGQLLMLAHTYTHLHPHRSIMVPEVQKAQKTTGGWSRDPTITYPSAVPVMQWEFITSAYFQPVNISPHLLRPYCPHNLLCSLCLAISTGSLVKRNLNPTFLPLHISGTCTTSALRCLTRKYPANLHVVCRMNSLMTVSLIVFPAKCCLLLLPEQSCIND